MSKRFVYVLKSGAPPPRYYTGHDVMLDLPEELTKVLIEAIGVEDP